MTPAEAVAELERIAAAEGATTAALVLLLDNEPILRTTGESLLDEATDLMRDGARPIGYLLLRDAGGGHIQVRHSALPEYAEDERVEAHLITLLASFRDLVLEKGAKLGRNPWGIA